MSTLEYVIWHILGYAAMPVIILAGFIAVAVVCIGVLSITKDKQID
ncbi:TIGR02808 family protein [Oceanisphaera arctica]|uniref:TIGR02808 family protein n=1 Tax=Oceanisphaera arctica TaxID=641510 RepID=A0A2P5TN62_9GAMM|nr:TIGR02808 family protein [Oceanisphaera arctica]PPL16899.1 TIGR02808 family protein [Oceanisphaera arctica]GHA19368.1 TIGR02808 family protein [Oceanisphaera arctica]